MGKFILPRKIKLTAHGQSNVFTKGPIERAEHVLMKAFIWALYLPQYPDLTVEVRVGDRYKPDVVAVDEALAIKDANGAFTFWGESGRVGEDKIFSLAKRFPSTHFVIAKWEKNLRPLEKMVREAVNARERIAPFDLLRFEDADADRFIDERGNVTLTHDDLSDWIRIMPD
ncbi:MAG: hypothetical protein AAFU54_18095 [Chloroflexota bacterium]